MNLLDVIFNRTRSFGDNLATILNDPVANAKLSIKDMQHAVQKLNEEHVSLQGSINLHNTEIGELKAKVTELDSFCTRLAASDKFTADVKNARMAQAVSDKQAAEKRIAELQDQNTQNEAEIQKVTGLIETFKTRIDDDTNNLTRVTAEYDSAKIRSHTEKILSQTADADGGGGMGALEEEAKKIDADADAREQVREENEANSIQGMEKMLDDHEQDVKDEVQKYLDAAAAAKSGASS